jgi:hypothetical protein
VIVEEVTAKCPTCGWRFRPTPVQRTAVVVRDRTCRNPRCGERWRMKITQIFVLGNVVGHEVEFTNVWEP